MLTISAMQFEALAEAIGAPQRRLRARRMLDAFPRFNGSLDVGRVEHLLRVTDARAGELGFGSERGSALFGCLGLRLGIDWDRDPQHAWARAALGTPEAQSPAEAIAALLAAVTAYRAKVMGSDDGRFVSAAQRFASRPAAQWLVAAGRSQADLLAHLAWLHPEKRASVPDETLAGLVRIALDDCRAIGMAERPGIVLVTVLCFLFGAGLLRDPVHAEVRSALADPARAAGERVLAAAQAATDWVNRHLLAPGKDALPVIAWPVPGLDRMSVEPAETMIVRPHAGRN
jgi:hypothetical protein